MHFHIIVAIAENIDQVGTFFIDGFRYCIWHRNKETGHPSLFTAEIRRGKKKKKKKKKETA